MSTLLNPDDNKVKKENNFADKEITTDDRSVRREIYQGYYVFLIPKDKTVNFRIIAIKAINKEATQRDVYWVAQSYHNFKTHKWLSFKVKGKEKSKEQSRTLAEHLNFLNEGYQDHKGEKYTEEGTKYVGKNYAKASYQKLMGKDTFGYITYKCNTLGAGIWLEGVNYRPGWMSQGAFVIAVDTPQITTFYAKKRLNTQERKLQFIHKDIQALETKLEYSNIVDLYIALHNVPYYDIELTVTVDGKVLEQEHISLNRNIDNPALDYNIEQRYELYIKPEWIDTLNHEAGTNNEDSIKTGKLSIVLVPNRAVMHAPYTEEQVKKLKKEITFKINYKDAWSIDTDEQEWIPQIVEIYEAPLVTQDYEECGYSSIQVDDGVNTPVYLLKEEGNGCLSANKTTEILEYVAGNKNNTHEITILLKDVDTQECYEAGFDNATGRSKSHKDNIFIVPDYDIEKDSNTAVIIGRETKSKKWELFAQNRFEDTPVFKELGKRTQEQLKFRLAYPYDAYNEHTFLLKYLTFQIKPEYLPIVIQTCRYVRTPVFKVYPDVVFVYHYMYNPKKELWFNNTKVDLPELKADAVSYVKDIVDWLFDPLKPILEKMGVGKEMLSMIKKYVNSPSPEQKTGFHMIADGEEINYSQLQPYKAYLHYQMILIALLPLIIELLLIYLTRGKNLQTKLGKIAKKAQNISKDLKDLGSKYNIEVTYPQLAINYGMYRQQEKTGDIATVLECNLQAAPLIGLKTTQKFDFEFPGGKVGLKAIFEGKIDIDLNLKYNTYTEVFTLTKNARDQVGKSKIPFKAGDVIKADRYITCEVKTILDIDKQGDFRIIGIPIPYNIKVDTKFDINGTIGMETRFGYHKEHGLYYQNSYYFTGANGKYKVDAEISAGIFGMKHKSGGGDTAKWEKIQVLKPFTWQEPRIYLVKTFKNLATTNKNNSKHVTAPKAPQVDFSTYNSTTKH
ncbi:hypothetical protein A8C32_16340 [Flavivirga aquatica]|uniref:Uncharacterized protein n=1 Tax=Flavivirga aquatica TaxID=1849968 RepID=A0A1E5T9H8_9FLAO|nr:hypothetical protein [Flavivirga aquatica]OEK08024.1 hypothetical protein A8C32_16340 [Flavivirga aquatica]